MARRTSDDGKNTEPILPTEVESIMESDKKKEVPVPSWRFMEFSALTDPDTDIEDDLDDSAYVKRHAKLELDEKRRKRWDAQRQREENYIRQLKDNEAKRAERNKLKLARLNQRKKKKRKKEEPSTSV